MNSESCAPDIRQYRGLIRQSVPLIRQFSILLEARPNSESCAPDIRQYRGLIRQSVPLIRQFSILLEARQD